MSRTAAIAVAKENWQERNLDEYVCVFHNRHLEEVKNASPERKLPSRHGKDDIPDNDKIGPNR